MNPNSEAVIPSKVRKHPQLRNKNVIQASTINSPLIRCSVSFMVNIAFAIT